MLLLTGAADAESAAGVANAACRRRQSAAQASQMLLPRVANAASGIKVAAQAWQMLLTGVANVVSAKKSAAQASQMLLLASHLLVVITIRNHWSRSLVLVTLHSLTL